MYSQKIVITEAETWTEIPESIPLSVAKDQAKDATIREAIEKSFGSAIYQNSSLALQTENGKTTSDFQVRSDSYVRGIWLETLSLKQEVSLKKQHNKESWWLRTAIRGRARELSSPPVNLKFLMSNCPSATCATTSFFSGDRIYALVESDKSGYLAIFLDDRSVTYQILPYQRMPEGSPQFNVLAQKLYILFSTKPEHNYFRQNPYFQEDELIVATDKQEYYRLYALWTPNEIGIPKVKVEDISEPGKMTSTDFQHWLSKTLSQEEQAALKIVDIAFLPKNATN